MIRAALVFLALFVAVTFTLEAIAHARRRRRQRESHQLRALLREIQRHCERNGEV